MRGDVHDGHAPDAEDAVDGVLTLEHRADSELRAAFEIGDFAQVLPQLCQFSTSVALPSW